MRAGLARGDTRRTDGDWHGGDLRQITIVSNTETNDVMSATEHHVHEVLVARGCVIERCATDVNDRRADRLREPSRAIANRPIEPLPALVVYANLPLLEIAIQHAATCVFTTAGLITLKVSAFT